MSPLGDLSDLTLRESGKWDEFRRVWAENQIGDSISLDEWIEFEQEKLLGDAENWRAVGEEYQGPSS